MKKDSSSINFSNPFKGKKWLELLEPSSKLGMKLKPDLKIENRNTLGFTFKSNSFGFHGCECANAENVILGTSFGMGFGVDEGENWFQLDADIRDSFFNLALPVSPGNHLKALDEFYSGNFNTLLYIYHPNVWKTASGFYKCESLGKSIFEFLNWRTDSLSLFRTVPKWILKEIYFLTNKIKLKYRSDGETYYVNTNYNRYDPDLPEFKQCMDDLVSIFKKFQRVIIFRVPIKEQILQSFLNDEKLDRLNLNYNVCWRLFTEERRIQSLENIRFIDLCKNSFFKINDYLPNDTHWSTSGNIKFHKIVNQNLNAS